MFFLANMESNQQKVTWNSFFRHGFTQVFGQPGEKRNATEIMHAYVGSGLEVLSDKGRQWVGVRVVTSPQGLKYHMCRENTGKTYHWMGFF